MPLFTIEIAGRATLVLPAPDYVQAMSYAADGYLHSELMTLMDVDGAPLWDGEAEWLVVDPAQAPSGGPASVSTNLVPTMTFTL